MRVLGWILFALGVAQTFYAGLGFSVVTPDAPEIANSDLIAQRALIHAAGCATLVAGAVFVAAAHIADRIKPPPPPPVQYTE